MTITLSYSQFEERYKPLKNRFNSNASLDGCMLETYGSELAFVLKHNPRYIWTWIDSYNNGTCLVPDYHQCNRIGYVITHNAWDDENLVVILP